MHAAVGVVALPRKRSASPPPAPAPRRAPRRAARRTAGDAEMSDGPLPPDWEATTDPSSGNTYYYNTKTNAVSWEAVAPRDTRANLGITTRRIFLRH